MIIIKQIKFTWLTANPDTGILSKLYIYKMLLLIKFHIRMKYFSHLKTSCHFSERR